MLKELEHIVRFFEMGDPLFRMSILSEAKYKNKTYPIYSFSIGSSDVSTPVLLLVGGVHGLERIGAQVVINYLRSLMTQMSWDEKLRETFKHYRIVAIPVLNPWGIEHFRRANGNGVDLMRNSPTEGIKDSRWKIYRGHSLGPILPWYRGKKDQMEVEARALCYLVEKEIFPSKCALAIDFHSGFGVKDRLWYPYAKSFSDFPFINQAKKITELLGETHPFHVYQVESQSVSYTTHGDLWDYLVDKYHDEQKNPEGIFIPWTLEMGSWNWLKKNPLQIFDRKGVFNPIVKHRMDRTMRRHFILIHFFTRLILNKKAWNQI
jgi:hypothetical protein